MNELLNTLLQTSVAFGIYIIAVVAYNLVGFAKKRSTIKELADIRIKWKTSKFWGGFLDKAFIGLAILMFTIVLQVILHQTGSIDVAGIELTRDSMIVVLYAATVTLTGAGVKNIASQLEVSDEDLVKYAKEADEQNYTETLSNIGDAIRSYLQSAEDSEPTDQEIQESISGTGGVLVNPLSRILSNGDNDNGRGWQCSKYTWFLASGVRMNYAPHPDYGPVDGTYIAQYLIDKLGYVRCSKQIGAIFSYVNHTGIITNVNADGTVDVNEANSTPLRVGSRRNVRLEGKTNLMYACRPDDLNNPDPAPVPQPTPTPTPQPSTPAPTVPNNPVDSEIKVGDSVVAWGVGTADSYGGGATTRNFPRTIMKVIGINNGRYALNQFDSGTVGNVADTTGWWVREQIDKN